MAVAAASVSFLGIVILLTMLGARRTRGRACCAPANPADDVRMHYSRLEGRPRRD
jgi:hypothetical protein